MPKTEIRLVVFSCAWKQARSWIFPEACKVFQTSLPNPVTQILSMWVLCTNRIRTGKITCACFFVIFWKMGFSFYTLYSEGSWYDTLGARGFFSCCLRRKLSGEAAIVTSGKKNPLVHDRGLAAQFSPQTTGKKILWHPGYSGTSAEWAFIIILGNSISWNQNKAWFRRHSSHDPNSCEMRRLNQFERADILNLNWLICSYTFFTPGSAGNNSFWLALI